MPLYSYVARSIAGESKKGVLEAKSENDLARTLRQDGLILIAASLGAEKKERKKISFSVPIFGRVSLLEKIVFARSLKVMVAAGVVLPRVLKILSNQARNKKMSKALIDVSEMVTRGKSFSESLSSHQEIFPEIFCSMIKVGEEAGTLEESLDVMIRQMEREHELKSKIKGALIYPAVIISAMAAIGILMLVVVIPRLAETFAELEIELPLTTRIVVKTGTFLSEFWYLLPVFLLCLILAVRFLVKLKAGKSVIDLFMIKTPGISSFVKKINLAYTVRTLSSLIEAGVPIVRSLEVVSASLSNTYYKNAMAEAAVLIKEGKKLGEVLKVHDKIYPDLVIQMIEIGEETGETTKVLNQLADFFEDEVARATKNISSIVEPVLMLIIGAVVGFFAISMLQPIYSMLSAFQ